MLFLPLSLFLYLYRYRLPHSCARKHTLSGLYVQDSKHREVTDKALKAIAFSLNDHPCAPKLNYQ